MATKKRGISKLFAAIAAAALASAMMAPAAFAVDYPSVSDDVSSVDATTSNTAGEPKASGTASTGVYIQVTANDVLSVTVPTKIYLAAENSGGADAVDLKVPTNVQITNLGMASQVKGWTVNALNGKGDNTLANADEFYLTAKTQRATTAENPEYLSSTKDAVTTANSWKMNAASDSASGDTFLTLTLAGKIKSPTPTDSALIDTITWNIASQATNASA